MNSRCMCGAVDCPSCGPAQGYSPCPFCGEVECECTSCSVCDALVVTEPEIAAGMCVECMEREAKTVDGDCCVRSSPEHYACTRPADHEGPHIALGGVYNILEVWK